MRPFLLLAVLACTALQAQTLTENYIELSITDTIPMRVKRIAYDFTPQAVEASADAVYEDSEDWEKVQKKLEKEAKEKQEQLLKDLTKEGFKATVSTGTDIGYNISSYEDASTQNAVHVEMTSESELKRLVAYLRANQKGDGSVSAWEYEASGENEVQLMERLFAKASAQAGTVARLGGRKLGKLISAHGPEANEGHWLTELIGEVGRAAMMKGALAEMPGLFSGREKTLIFRFALLD
ncbi:MAG TPA: hypothetical protein VGE21_17020 [Flavobacteriales bacterium]